MKAGVIEWVGKEERTMIRPLWWTSEGFSDRTANTETASTRRRKHRYGSKTTTTRSSRKNEATSSVRSSGVRARGEMFANNSVQFEQQ